MDAVYIQAAVSAVTGGLAGAAVNAFITSRRQRLDTTLIVIRDFFAFYRDIGEVKSFFEESDLNNALKDRNKFNRLRRVGDWHNYVASLIKEGAVNVSLLTKVGVIKEIENFKEAITSAKSQAPSYLENVWAWWDNIREVRT